MKLQTINGKKLERCPYCKKWIAKLNWKRHLEYEQLPTYDEAIAELDKERD
jgi:hypothetical protein